MTDLTLTTTGRVLTLERIIDAPRSAVWRAWTDPAILQQWFCPAPWRVSAADFDLRPGGRMNTVMEGPAGERMESKGCWLEVEPERALTFTDAFTEGFDPAPEPFMTGFVRLSDEGPQATRMLWGRAARGRGDGEKTPRHGVRNRLAGRRPTNWRTSPGRSDRQFGNKWRSTCEAQKCGPVCGSKKTAKPLRDITSRACLTARSRRCPASRRWWSSSLWPARHIWRSMAGRLKS